MQTNLSCKVKKIKLKNGYWVLNHSLLMEQIYIKDLSLLKDSSFNNILSEKGFTKNERNEKKIKNSIIRCANNSEFNLLRILLTDLCNLRCEYCKVCNNIENPIKTPSPIERVKDAVDKLFEKHRKPKVIHITGGEPLIFYNRVKEIINYIVRRYQAEKYSYVIIVGTNGVLLDQPKIDFFKEKKVKVIISLDGDEESNRLRIMQNGKSSFKYAIAALDRLKHAGIEYGISMVIGGHNIEIVSQDIAFLLKRFSPSSIGVNFIKNTKISKKSELLISGRSYADAVYAAHREYRNKGIYFELLARKIFPFVLQEYRLYDCGASNGTTINIDAAGNVGTCKSFLCLKTLYSDKDIDGIIDNFKGRSPLFNEYCANCFAQGICGNGCAYEANIDDKNNIIDKRACEYVTSFYSKFIYDLLELNIKQAERSIKLNGYYIPSKNDRRKILGNVKKDLLTLRQCIGHEI